MSFIQKTNSEQNLHSLTSLVSYISNSSERRFNRLKIKDIDVSSKLNHTLEEKRTAINLTKEIAVLNAEKCILDHLKNSHFSNMKAMLDQSELVPHQDQINAEIKYKKLSKQFSELSNRAEILNQQLKKCSQTDPNTLLAQTVSKIQQAAKYQAENCSQISSDYQYYFNVMDMRNDPNIRVIDASEIDAVTSSWNSNSKNTKALACRLFALAIPALLAIGLAYQQSTK